MALTMDDIGDIRLSPKDALSIDWSIYDYFNMPQRADTYFNSPVFIFEENYWCLRLYPNGCREDSTIGNVELNLVKVSDGEACYVSYIVGIKNWDGSIRSSKLMEMEYYAAGDYGGDKIIKRTRLLRWRHAICPHNIMTVFIKDLIQHNKPGRDAYLLTTTGEEVRHESVDSLVTHKKGEEDSNETVDPSITHKKGEENSNETVDAATTVKYKGEEIGNEKMDPLIAHTENEEVGNEKMDPFIAHRESIEILLKNFKDLFLNEENCDVTFKVQNQEFQAHRSILIARSPYFASMFRHDMSEKNTGIVNVPD